MSRKLLFVGVLILFFQLSAGADSTLRIVQISDVQLGSTEARAMKNGKTVESGIDANFFEEAVNMINGLQPEADLVINTGDLVNDHTNEEQWKDYCRISQKLKSPLYEVMGNHDGWTDEGVAEFRKRFQQNDYYSFIIRNCRFIVLNSWYLKDPGRNPECAEKQKQFLENVLKEDKSAFRIIMLHFPLFAESPEEEDAYFNLPRKDRDWLLEMAVKYKVRLILTGHNHRNIIKTYRDSVTLITTGPVSEPIGLNDDNTVSKRGYRVIDINLTKGTFTHEFIPLPDSLANSDYDEFTFIFPGGLLPASVYRLFLNSFRQFPEKDRIELFKPRDAIKVVCGYPGQPEPVRSNATAI